MPDDRCGIIGENARHRWQVAHQILIDLIVTGHVVKDMPHRVLAFGLGIEVAHGLIRNRGQGG